MKFCTKKKYTYLFYILLFNLYILYCEDENSIIQNIFNYKNLCMKGELLGKQKYNLKKPYYSIIIPVYNKEKYLIGIIRSIQNQSYKNLEIIFSDDCSTDKSVEIIENEMKNDKRIKLIKHNKNRSSLYARVHGIKHAKGKYIIFCDPDDFLVNDILNKIYKYTLGKNSYDIIQFKVLCYYKKKGSDRLYRSNYPLYRTDKTEIYQPELSYYLYYKNNTFGFYVKGMWGRAYKKKVLLNSIKYIGINYINQYMGLHQDGLLIFAFFRVSNSFIFFNEYGYLYLPDQNSVTRRQYDINKINNSFFYKFQLLKFLNEFTFDSQIEKYIPYKFCNYGDDFNEFFFRFKENIKKDFDLYIKILDDLINTEYFLDYQKNEILIKKNILEKLKTKNFKNDTNL